MNLSEIIDFLTKNNKLSINIYDVVGIIKKPPFLVDYIHQIHTKRFCNAAKNTPNGYSLCTRCKYICCKKATRTLNPFWGMCPYGLNELVYPIVDNGKLVCILFIGNQIEDINATLQKAKQACDKTGVNYNLLAKHIFEAEKADKEESILYARLIESFILLNLKTMPKSLKSESSLHWIIHNIKNYADLNFDQPIKLKELSRLYFINEKYAGRLFKTQIGCSFHQYVNNKRLKMAEDLLLSTDKAILDIAVECGFNSISHFNRMFYCNYNKTPKEYRKAFGRHILIDK